MPGVRRAVVLAGPTATGKSALALAVARECNGVVINADSMQVYRELPVLTAQPGAAERAAAAHRLYGFVTVSESCSAADWAALARAEIDQALGEGRLPIVVGGTGLYIKALLEGLAAVPEIPAEVRAAARRRLSEIGKAAFHDDLGRRDPAMASRIRPSDSQRLLRAWEVIEATGQSLAAWQARQEPSPWAGGIDFVKLVVMPERSELHAACDQRFRDMVGRGALEEARALADRADNRLPAMKALGLRELIGHVRGEATLEQAIAAAQQATRRYAKRQLTWFRHQLAGGRTIPVSPLFGKFSESFLAEIYNIIRSSG